MQSRLGLQQMAQMNQKPRSPSSNPSSGLADSGAGSMSRSTNVPNCDNQAISALNNMFTHIGGNVNEFSLNRDVPQPLNLHEPTNERSKMAVIEDEQHSMVIEANGKSVRLNVKKNQGKVGLLDDYIML